MPTSRPLPLPIAAHFAQQLKARGCELSSPLAAMAAGTVELPANRLHAVDVPGHGRLHVLVPVNLKVQLGADGTVSAVEGGEPDESDVRAAELSLADLIASHRLEDPANRERTPGATHVVVTAADGRRVVRRKGFDASPGAARR